MKESNKDEGLRINSLSELRKYADRDAIDRIVAEYVMLTLAKSKLTGRLVDAIYKGKTIDDLKAIIQEER